MLTRAGVLNAQEGMLNTTKVVLASKEWRVLHAIEGAALNASEMVGGAQCSRGCLRPRIAECAE